MVIFTQKEWKNEETGQATDINTHFMIKKLQRVPTFQFFLIIFFFSFFYLLPTLGKETLHYHLTVWLTIFILTTDNCYESWHNTNVLTWQRWFKKHWIFTSRLVRICFFFFSYNGQQCLPDCSVIWRHIIFGWYNLKLSFIKAVVRFQLNTYPAPGKPELTKDVLNRLLIPPTWPLLDSGQREQENMNLIL